MSDPLRSRINIGAYQQPFSGVGVEFEPLGIQPDRTGITLHEAGFEPSLANWNFPGVFSPFWRLYYNERQGHHVHFGQRRVQLGPPHLMLIPPHCLFQCLGHEPVPHLWTAFSFIHHLHPDMSPPLLLPVRDTELCLIRDLQRLILTQENVPSQRIYRNSLALLQVVMARPELRWQAPLPQNLARMRSHIEENIARKLSSSTLARFASLSVAGLNRAFRRHLGVSPARYVTETRVREAARLLLQTEDGIEAIADRTGFPNRAYFSRVFSRVIGQAPASFRRSHQGKALWANTPSLSALTQDEGRR